MDQEIIQMKKAAEDGEISRIKAVLRSATEQRQQLKDIGLLSAAEQGHLPAVKYLLKRRARFYPETDSHCPSLWEDGITALHLAVQGHHIDVVRYLLRTRRYVSFIPLWPPRGYWMTALHTAAAIGDSDIAKLLLDSGVDVNCENTDESLREKSKWVIRRSKHHSGYRTALSVAAENGSPLMIKLLLDRGADPCISEPSGASLLHLAAQGGHNHAITSILDLQANVDIDALNNDGETPFWIAVFSGHETTVDLLLDKGASIACGQVSYSRVFAEIVPKRSLVILKTILEHSGDDVPSRELDEALDLATRGRHLEAVEILQAHTDKHHTAKPRPPAESMAAGGLAHHRNLTEVVRKGNMAMLRVMLRYYGVNIPADEFRSALGLAACEGLSEAIEILLSHKGIRHSSGSESAPEVLSGSAEVYEPKETVNTFDLSSYDRERILADAALSAGFGGQRAILETLLEACDSEKEFQTLVNRALLGSTISDNNVFLVKWLLKREADPSILTLRAAIASGATQCCEILLDANPDVINPPRSREQPILHSAIISGNSETVKLFLSRGANPNAESFAGKTSLQVATGQRPLHEATEQGYEKKQYTNIQHLLQFGADVNGGATDPAHSPVVLAAKRGYRDIVKLLIASGCKFAGRAQQELENYDEWKASLSPGWNEGAEWASRTLPGKS
ncbi:ankyrin repeat-containing domain protein [Aspergillus karnatakaensis]|uniref:ankyrin repeat-containing domain protein n=1 Tax=Aspergillus karnatakaensis TaxID=1810916 RepID=UPI003CCCCDB2